MTEQSAEIVSTYSESENINKMQKEPNNEQDKNQPQQVETKDEKIVTWDQIQNDLQRDQQENDIQKEPSSARKPTPELTTKEKMVKELEKMKRADDLREEWRVYEYKKLYRKHKEELERQKLSKGIELNAGVNESKQAIKTITDEEEFFALKKQRRQFREESALIRRKLEEKMGLLVRRDNPDLKQMVETFIYKPENNSSIPSHILKVLSWAEIEDLKNAFDLFDIKGKGYITSKDVKRIAKMLGFRATKVVFDGMISELAGPDKDRVTFINFLEFIIKSQGEGPDPYDEIVQNQDFLKGILLLSHNSLQQGYIKSRLKSSLKFCGRHHEFVDPYGISLSQLVMDLLPAFKLMDTNENGYVTLGDLKTICESVNLNFSNKILREMIEEADNTGDGKISLQEFTNIMCQTGRFKLSAPQ